ncbi:hypothetical protein [Streptomyces sp.]|uniref:hypothetical protein n=1 Tax=Streptomyces sp. TaxID=1931 RepID=UPI002F92B37F
MRLQPEEMAAIKEMAGAKAHIPSVRKALQRLIDEVHASHAEAVAASMTLDRACDLVNTDVIGRTDTELLAELTDLLNGGERS